MPIIKTIKYNSDALEKIFWKGYEYYSGRESLSLHDMVIDAKPISKNLGVSKRFVLNWVAIVQKEMGIKSTNF
jgi:hypothetical protein